MTETYRGQAVTILGLGLFGGGVGAARFLARHGARLTVTDLRDAGTLAPSLAALEGLDVRLVLGGHDEADVTGADLVVVNPAVPIDAPLLEAARAAGVPLETEVHLFATHCRAPILGVTGSNGKTTTTSLLARMIREAGRTTWLGGNIGRSLLDVVERIEPDHRVVLELSSFQLEHLGRRGFAPRVAVVTNLAPNHLEWHGGLDNYAAAKARIVTNQRAGDAAVLNALDPTVAAWADRTAADVSWFSAGPPRQPGVWAAGDRVVATDGRDLFAAADLRLPGRFNLANAMAAAAAALADGVAPEAIGRGVREFRAVEHRLEPVATLDGATWYNDSVATTPESTMAALEALDGPIVLIAGGHDKGLPLEALARTAVDRARAIVLVGPMADRFEAALAAAGSAGLEIVRVERLAAAVEAAHRLSAGAAAVVLSPATSSYDEFANFTERGKAFKSLVGRLAPRCGR